MDAPPGPGVWRRVGPDALDPRAAVDRPLRLLDRMADVGPPVTSWSTVTRPCLVLGRTGRPAGVNAAHAAAAGIEVVERRSGGQPVLWDAGLLSLDVVLPPGHALAGRDVTLAYRWLGDALANGLRDAGVPGTRTVSIGEAREHAARGDAQATRARRACFGALSPFEVVAADGRKLVGLAQARRRAGTLFQCGVLMRWAPATLAACLEADPGEVANLWTNRDFAALKSDMLLRFAQSILASERMKMPRVSHA